MQFIIPEQKRKSTEKSVPVGVFSLSLLPIRLLPEAAKVLLHLLFGRHNGKRTASCRHKRSCRICKGQKLPKAENIQLLQAILQNKMKTAGTEGISAPVVSMVFGFLKPGQSTRSPL